MSPTYDPSNKIRCNFKEILNNVISLCIYLFSLESCAYPRRCEYDISYTCQCDNNCFIRNDCCNDKMIYCPT